MIGREGVFEVFLSPRNKVGDRSRRRYCGKASGSWRALPEFLKVRKARGKKQWSYLYRLRYIENGVNAVYEYTQREERVGEGMGLMDAYRR